MSEQRSPGTPGRGATTISWAVVSSIVGRILEEETSAESTPGGTRLPGDASPTVGEFFGGLAGSQRGARGVSVEVGEGEVAVDLTVALPYGSSVPEITNRMRRSVIRGIEEMTGLRVTQVDITVNAMFPPGGNR